MRKFFTLTCCLFLFFAACAQDDLLDELEKEQGDVTDYTIQTFKGTRIINGHSIETKPAGALEFIINHRFGPLYDTDNLAGFDYAYIRLGLEYGITDNLGVGVGRSSLTKEYDMYLKYKVLKQSSGTRAFPFTMTLLGFFYHINSPFDEYETYSSSDRKAYQGQILIARKFSPSVSFQVSPTILHRNRVDAATEVSDLFVVGLGGRVKITKSVALSAEYFPRLNEKENNPYNDAYGVGVDIETGGHVFQLIFTNSIGAMDRIMLTQSGIFKNEDHSNPIHFGFNITRTFQLTKKSRAKSW